MYPPEEFINRYGVKTKFLDYYFKSLKINKNLLEWKEVTLYQ